MTLSDETRAHLRDRHQVEVFDDSLRFFGQREVPAEPFDVDVFHDELHARAIHGHNHSPDERPAGGSDHE